MKIIFVLLAFFTSQAFASECISQHQIRGFSDASNTNVTVHTRDGDYAIEVSYCWELPYAFLIAFDSITNQVCWGDRLVVLDNFSEQVIESCRILDINKF